MKTHMRNPGSKKWRLRWRSLEGPTWTQEDANVAFDWSISGYLPLFMFLFPWLLITHWELLISLSLMHVWLLYSLETLACWLYRLIFSFILTYWLSLLYDYSAHLDMLLLILFILTWLILLIVYYHDCYGACYPC